MDYTNAREYLAGLNKYGSVLGLGSIRELLRRLGDPQERMKFVHVAGTNGKGSVCTFLASILQEAGYHVGRYSSPAVFEYREIMQRDGEPIPEEALALLTEKAKRACDSMVADGLPHPTVFEVETAIAFLFFVHSGCDLAVVECGLGGLEDATNVIRNTELAVLTSISPDHMAILGNTIGEIAANKAGIIKPGCTVASAHQLGDAAKVIEEKAKSEGCSICKADPGRITDAQHTLDGQTFTYVTADGTRYENLHIALTGLYQLQNASLALEAARALIIKGYPLEEHIPEGLAKAYWPGRFEVIVREPLVILDGAHNRDGARALEETIRCLLPDRKIVMLLGMFADKEVDAAASILTPLAEKVIAIQTPESARALPAEELLKIVHQYQANAECEASIGDAVRKAVLEYEKIKRGGEDAAIIACGSLSHLRYMKKEFKKILEGAYEFTE